MGIRIDGNNDLIKAVDDTLTIEGISVNTSGMVTATGGVKVGTAATIHSTGQFNIGVAHTLFANGNATHSGIITASSAVLRGDASVGYQALKLVNTQHDTNNEAAAQIKFGITNSLGERNARIEAKEVGGNANDVALDFYTNSANGVDSESFRMRVHYDGKVGIGTSLPDSLLHVFAPSVGYAKIETRDGGTNPIIMHENPDRIWHAGLRGDTSDGYVIRDATGSVNRLVIDTSGNVQMPADTVFLQIGASQDLDLHHNGTNSYIRNKTGDLHIRPLVAEEGIILKPNGSVEIYYDNARKFRTVSDGVEVNSAEGGSANLALIADEGDDNADYWRLSGSSDGSLYIQNYTSGSWEKNLKATGDAGVDLYYDNAKRFSTTAGGNSSLMAGANTFTIGSSDAGGAHLSLDGDSNGDAVGSDYSGLSHNTDGNLVLYQNNPNSNGQIDIKTGGANRLSIQSDKFRPANDNAMTLGTSGLAWANVFSDGNYVVNGASGTGVDFAHGSSAGTAANILDDYEEGSWTPGFYPMSSAMTISYSLQTGTYRRIGNVCYWAFRVRLSGLSGQMGQNMGFGGLPFNVDSSQPQFSANVYGSGYSGEIPDGLFYQGGVNRGDLYYPTNADGATRAVLQASDCNPSDSYTAATGFFFIA